MTKFQKAARLVSDLWFILMGAGVITLTLIYVFVAAVVHGAIALVGRRLNSGKKSVSLNA